MQRTRGCTNIIICSFLLIIIVVFLSRLFQDEIKRMMQEEGSFRIGNLYYYSSNERMNCEEDHHSHVSELEALVESLREEQRILLENEDKWLEEKEYLGNKLNEAIKDKLEALESKMRIIIQSKEREEEFIDVMERIAELEEESSLKTMELLNKTTQIEDAKQEIWNLRLRILESC